VFIFVLTFDFSNYLVSLTEKNKSDKIKARIAEKKEKRLIENKILNVKKLADSDSEEDAVSWVKKTKTIQDEMEKAKKRVTDYIFFLLILSILLCFLE